MDQQTHRTSPAGEISTGTTLLLALACGVVVANLYYVQPIVGILSRAYGLDVSTSGALVTVTQVGYATGLLLIVPLGDIVENRHLILSLLAALFVAVVAAAIAPSAALFLLASFVIGISASAVQVIVPFAGHLSSDARRGRVVGNVVSGLLFGIMLSRPAASFAAEFIGPRSIFVLSAGAILGLVGLLVWRLPRRRPRGMPYGATLASLWPLLRDTEVLHRRGAYQAAMFGCFSLFWTAVPLVLENQPFAFTQGQIGLFALVGAGGAFASPLAGRAADAGYGRAVTGLALTTALVSLLLALGGGLMSSWLVLVIAGLILDMAVAATLVIGQREIFALGAEARGRLNGLYLAIFFFGGATGSFLAGVGMGHGGWTVATLIGAAFPAIALIYFMTERKTT